jgi:glyoxylase-like metal-dependent hydrolase (beta-lactamase superfamily II)
MEIHHLILGPLGTNCYLLSSGPDRETIIVDPGEDADIILKEIQRKNLKPTAILNTHGHIDHVAAAGELQQALNIPFHIHRDDEMWLDQLKTQALTFGLRVPAKPRIDHYLQEGDTIAFGDDTVKVICTPGHTKGGVSFLVGDSLFVGDTLFASSIGRTDLPGGSYETLMKSIREKLLSLDEDCEVYPGHGPATSLKHERLFNPFIQ